MKLIAIAIAFVATAAFANPTATTGTTGTTGTTTTTTTGTTAPTGTANAEAHGGHAKGMMKGKADKKGTTATAACSKEDEAAGKCMPEMKK